MSDLKSKESLSVLIMAIAKRNGGEVRLTEAEMAQVSRNDGLALYWDPQSNEVVLRCITADETLIGQKIDYEN